MLLAVDVGNTNIVMGIYDREKLVTSWRCSTAFDRTSDESGLLFMQFFNHNNIDKNLIEDVIISSVVPPVMYAFELAILKYLNKRPIIVDYKTDTGINICIDNPKELGADRIVNAVAAIDKYGGPLIVIDFGTATTFCSIDADKNYLGGVICPGIKISMDALHTKAAKLPRVEIAEPEHVIGKNTIESMQSGAIYGFAGQVDYIVNKMREELDYEPKVIATGGFARMIARESKTINEVNSRLTLEGLRIIYSNLT